MSKGGQLCSQPWCDGEHEKGPAESVAEPGKDVLEGAEDLMIEYDADMKVPRAEEMRAAIAAFATAHAMAEREACAKFIENIGNYEDASGPKFRTYHEVVTYAAAAIRARVTP